MREADKESGHEMVPETLVGCQGYARFQAVISQSV